MMDEYPSEDGLEIIRKWDDLSVDGIDNLLSFIEDVWHWPEDGFTVRGECIRHLSLHTGGWSGNEDIIAALRDNIMFWTMYWMKSERGGHYFFEIRR